MQAENGANGAVQIEIAAAGPVRLTITIAPDVSGVADVREPSAGIAPIVTVPPIEPIGAARCANPGCARPFRPARSDARYCSARCRVAAHRARTQLPAET